MRSIVLCLCVDVCGCYCIICQYSLDFIQIYNTQWKDPFTHLTPNKNIGSTFIVYSVISFILSHHYRTCILFHSILFYSALLHNILFNLCTIVRYRCAYSVRQFIQLMIGLSSVYRSDVIQFRNCEIDGRIINIKANKQHQQRERWASLINGIGIGKDWMWSLSR